MTEPTPETIVQNGHAPQAQPTPARAWNPARVYMLPSGVTAKLKRPPVLALVGKGAHNPVSDAVLLQMHSLQRETTTDDQRIENIRANTRMYLEVLVLAFVEPRLVLDRAPEYDAGEIGPEDIEDIDLLWLGQTFLQGDANTLAPFRIE